MIQFDKRPALLDRPDNVSKCGILRNACEREDEPYHREGGQFLET